MTNATSNSKGQENLIPHYMHSSDGCIWGWVRSWAINLCSRAGCHTHSLSWSFPGKQLLWAPGMVGEFPLQPASTAGAVCPNSRATPSTHRWPFGGILRRWKWGEALQSTHQDLPHLPCQRGPEPTTLHGAISRPQALHTSDTTLPEELAEEEEPYENTQFQPFLKSQPWCGLTAKQHLPAPPRSCHLLTFKGSHQDAQVYFQSYKNS